MHIRRLAGLVPVAVAALVFTVAHPSQAAGCDRSCRIAAGDAYLASLVSHDASNVPLEENAQRYENGSNTGNGAQAIRDANASPIMFVITGIQDLHWEVEGQDAVASYFLDTVAPTYIIERFTVDDAGLISQIVANFYIDTSGYAQGPESLTSNPNRQVTRFTAYNHGPLGPVPVPGGNTGDDVERAPSACGRDCVSSAVTSFLDAMASHDASLVSLAGDATQTINHRPVGDIRAALQAANGITGISNRAVVIDGEWAVAEYDIALGSDVYHAGSRFLVRGGVIQSIASLCDGAETCTAAA